MTLMTTAGGTTPRRGALFCAKIDTQGGLYTTMSKQAAEIKTAYWTGVRENVPYFIRRAICDGCALAALMIPARVLLPHILREWPRSVFMRAGAGITLVYTWSIGVEICKGMRDKLIPSDYDREWHGA
jgi:hypothetical protein